MYSVALVDDEDLTELLSSRTQCGVFPGFGMALHLKIDDVFV